MLPVRLLSWENCFHYPFINKLASSLVFLDNEFMWPLLLLALERASSLLTDLLFNPSQPYGNYSYRIIKVLVFKNEGIMEKISNERCVYESVVDKNLAILGYVWKFNGKKVSGSNGLRWTWTAVYQILLDWRF